MSHHYVVYEADVPIKSYQMWRENIHLGKPHYLLSDLLGARPNDETQKKKKNMIR